MKITASRGAIAITLDRPRTLFFDNAATWQLATRYGAGFVRELYTLEGSGSTARVTLKSPAALAYFLWAGLQAELRETDEELTEEDAAALIRPWTLEAIFNALVMAITGAVSTPVQPGKAAGKDGAEEKQASPAAAASRKGSTMTRRRGSSPGR